MTKTVLAWLIMGVVIVGVGTAVIVNKTGEKSNKNQESAMMKEEGVMERNGAVAQSKATAGQYSGTFADLTKRGGDWVCTVDHSTVVSETDGQVYISGKNIRGEFSVDAPYVGNVSINMIADGSDVYTWSSMMAQGVKAPQSSIDKDDTDTQTSGQFVDSNQVLNYDCQPWARDDSKFAIPAISFMEVGY